MKNILKKLSTAIIGLTMAFGVGVVLTNAKNNKNTIEVSAANGDSHSIESFTGKGTGVVVNNGVTPSAISISDPGYPIKQVVIGWTHNKSNAGVTATVTIGNTVLGTGKVGGSNTTSTTTIGDGTKCLEGDISITWSSTLTSTGKGTLTLKSLALIEGGTTTPVDLTDIALPASGSVCVGKTISLKPTLTPSEANTKTTFVWSSNNTDVATVDSNGVVTGVSKGNATITLNATDIGKTATCDITVNNHGKEESDPLTVTEAISHMATSNSSVTELWYITGTVTDTPYNTTYGNFYLTDGVNTITIYGLTDSDSAVSYSSGKYSFSNPKNFSSGTLTSTIDKDSVIVMKARLYKYNTTNEADGVCLSVVNNNAAGFASYFLSETNKVCNDSTDNLTALQNIWTSLSDKYTALSTDEKAKVVESSANENINGAVARYKYICGKYNSASVKNLQEFINGVSVSYNASRVTISTKSSQDSTIIIISVVAATSVTMIGVLLVTKRRKSLVK